MAAEEPVAGEPSGGATQGATRRSYGQWCPVSRSLDLLGDRWALLVVRDLHAGPRRFGELRRDLDGISPTLLSRRLDQLTGAGLVVNNDGFYDLTDRGAETWPLIAELGRFGLPLMTRPDADDVFHEHYIPFGLGFLFRPERRPEAAARFVIDLGDTIVGVDVVAMAAAAHPARRISLTPVANRETAGEAELVVVATLGALTRLRQGRRSISDLEAHDLVRIDGDAAVRALFLDLLAPDT